MVAQALRELRRRAVRSALTAAGIAIGVAALVLLGALAEKFTRLLEGGRDFGAGQITVSGAGGEAAVGMSRANLVTGEQLATLRTVPGVVEVAPIVMFPIGDAPPLPFTLGPLAFGVDAALLIHNRRAPPPRVREGTLISGGPDEAVLGSEVAREFNAGIGSTITVRGHQFRVVGLLEPTLTGPDSFVMMSFPAAQRLLVDSEPLLRRLVSVPGTSVLPVATAAAVFWADGEDAEVVAERLRKALPGLSVVSPAQAEAQVDRALGFMNGVFLGAAVVALLIASLAVTNTMFTAVVERRREIGLRRVVGATRRQVVAQLVLEAVAIGVAGSFLGLAAGALVTSGLNAVTARIGQPVFLLTARLAALAIVLPPVLTALAGMLPAWRAARLAPTDALRYA